MKSQFTTRLFALMIVLSLIATSQVKAQCLFVDLQAVSIDPSPGSLNVGQTGQIVVVMKNNGPCPIPTSEAQVQVTFSSVFLAPGAPINVVDNCVPARWTLIANVPTPGLHNLFFRNTAGPIPVGGVDCSFQFNITGLSNTAGTTITLASTLSASATTSDADGSNQSASTQIAVSGTPDLTSSQFFTTTQIAAGGTIDEVVVIRNVGTGGTTAATVFSITNYTALTGLTVTSNPNPSVTIGIDNYTLDNANWTFNPALGTFTSNAGIFIPAGGSRNIGVRIVRGSGGAAGANGSVTQTTTIQAGTGGGETPITNNTISNSLLKN